jgi:hypothetical protein
LHLDHPVKISNHQRPSSYLAINLHLQNKCKFRLTFWYSRRPTTLKERSDWPRRGWVVRVCPAEYASLLLKCLSDSTSNFCRTEGRMARSVNMVLDEVASSMIDNQTLLFTTLELNLCFCFHVPLLFQLISQRQLIPDCFLLVEFFEVRIPYLLDGSLLIFHLAF